MQLESADGLAAEHMAVRVGAEQLHRLLDGFDPTTTKVAEHMSFPLKAAHHTDDLFQLIAKFIDYDTRHLLIEKDGKYIGVLYAKDVIRVGFAERSKQLDELDDMVSLEFYENWKRKKRNR